MWILSNPKLIFHLKFPSTAGRNKYYKNTIQLAVLEIQFPVLETRNYKNL